MTKIYTIINEPANCENQVGDLGEVEIFDTTTQIFTNNELRQTETLYERLPRIKQINIITEMEYNALIATGGVAMDNEIYYDLYLNLMHKVIENSRPFVEFVKVYE